MTLNTQGDRLIKTTGTHGSDISSQRMDELDRACLRFALESCQDGGTAIDMGSGLGAQSLRLASVGLDVQMIDLLDLSHRVSAINGLLGRMAVTALQKDVRILAKDDLPDAVDIIYSQRFLHYLRFEEARTAMAIVLSRLRASGQVFLSASGIRSELAIGYSEVSQPVNARFGRLAPNTAEKHDIKEPVCLYDTADLELLVRPFGLIPVFLGRSTFGNIKGIFRMK